MILQRINTRGGAVLLKFDCPDPTPGQCVTFGGRYFVIAHSFNGVGSVVTHPKSHIDMPPGTHVDLTPVGPGWDTTVEGTPVIVTGGLGYAAGLPLVRHFAETRTEFRMVVYTRHPGQFEDVVGLLNIRTSNVTVWNTRLRGRPEGPLDPIDIPLDGSTPVFFAGPRELQEALRSDLDKRGLSGVKIRNNY